MLFRSGLVINSPTLSSAEAGPFTVIVTGNWQSNTFTPGTYRVEVFVNTTADPSGHGQGKVFLGERPITVTANSNNFSFTEPNPFGFNLIGQVLSATITDPLNNTSEFSPDFTV